MTAKRRCVLLFARAPRDEERVKRIPNGTLLFEHARRRVEAAAASLVDVDLLVVAPAADAAPLVLPQRGDSFGERLANAFADARALGYRDVVAVPGDVPELTARPLGDAFEALLHDDVVLGPSPDGGVWLIGARIDATALFAGVPWRTRRVFAALRKNAPAAALLDALLDVDARSDLAAVRRSLAANRQNVSGERATAELHRILALLLRPASPERLLAAPRIARIGVSLLPASRAPPLLLASAA